LSPPRQPELAITIDDFSWQVIPKPFGPIANRTLLDTLEANGLKTALFAVGRNIESPEGRSLLGPWNDAGHIIGNHTYSHRNLHSLTEPEFEADVLRCHELLKPYPAYSCLFFRFPLLKEGNTNEKRDAMRQFLNAHGMRNGHVTIDASDWFYDAELRKRLAADPAYDVSRFRAPYLAHLLDRAKYYDRLARTVLGRSPRHTVLLHYNLINVLFLGDALRMFTEQGWKLVSAEYAYNDAVFKSTPANTPAGESLIWALAKQTGRFDKQLRYPGEDDVYEKPNIPSL
jgi:peptidoglycan/xylan/chitin deacetylase (PgdA/CDA1 family)